MTIQFQTLQQGFLEFLEAVPVISVAGSGSGATKIVDTALSIYGDGYFDDYWVYVTSGDAVGDIRQIATFTNADTTLDPYVDFSAAVANENTYEIHKHNPSSVQRAINDALVSLVSRPDPRTLRTHKLYKKIVFESLGLSLLASDATSGQPDVIITDGTLLFEGQEVTVKDDNHSEDATIKSISSNTLTMEKNLTFSYATDDNAKVVAKSGHYFNLGATIGLARVSGVFVRADATSKRTPFADFNIITSQAGDRQIYFPSSKSVDNQVWVIEAMTNLEQLTEPTDPVTVDDHRVMLIYAEAAYHLFMKQAQLVSVGDATRLLMFATTNRDRVDVDLKGLWMPLPQERISLKLDSDYD